MIAWTITDRIARITLSRPEARNAIPIAGWDALAGAAREVAASDATVAILASDVPGSFCAGADLTDLAILATDEPGRVRFRQAMRGGIDALAALPMPLIVAVDGGCYGAGVALALAADLIVAGDGAIFATTPAKLGIGYPDIDVAHLIARVGRGQASRMLLTAEPIDTDEAHRIGLAELRGDAGQVAGRMANLAPGALRLLKRTIAHPVDGDAAFDAAFGGSEFTERLTAFRERRR